MRWRRRRSPINKSSLPFQQNRRTIHLTNAINGIQHDCSRPPYLSLSSDAARHIDIIPSTIVIKKVFVSHHHHYCCELPLIFHYGHFDRFRARAIP